MATAAPSPLASSVEKTNGNKLSRLLIDGGTTTPTPEIDRLKAESGGEEDILMPYLSGLTVMWK
ncbi:unnamed protein product [Porites evermanni]|uniref:Uncharacterized protein n=1 Tax=Porites evermanni TaxID=104178 RepID=A0ABN8LJI4_9CNID|nr:unnamed protein product [Porites evermanni]